jgi:hypothetical protein
MYQALNLREEGVTVAALMTISNYYSTEQRRIILEFKIAHVSVEELTFCILCVGYMQPPPWRKLRVANALKNVTCYLFLSGS